MYSIRHDLRDALRAIRRDSSYGAAVVATLGLTLGACTAVFSIVNGVLLRPLDYPDSPSLVSIREVVPAIPQYSTLPVNARHFDEWRRRTTSFDGIAMVERRLTTLLGAGEPAQVAIVRASGSVFDVLRTPVALGRGLTIDDERPERAPVAVISARLWEERLGRSADVLSRTVTLGGTQYAIVGVLPAGAALPVFEPLAESATLSDEFAAIVPARINLANVGWMGQFNHPVMARLKRGITIEQARAELNVVQQSVAAITSRATGEPVVLQGWIMPLEEAIVGRARLALLLLLGAIGSVMLIACANLANLSLTRGLAHMRDAAVRTALGATRQRLVSRVIVEQLILAITGGALGVLVARFGLQLFVSTAPIQLPRASEAIIDGRVLGFAATVATLAGLCVGLLPAWRLARAGDVQAILRGGGHGTTDRGGRRVRATLLAIQVAVSVTLLVVTGLLITSFVRVVSVDTGFSTARVFSAEIAPVFSRYSSDEARAALYDRILTHVKTLPGVVSAAWTSSIPLTGETWVDAIADPADSRPSSQKPSANYRFIGPEYFGTLSMPLLRGRSIDERDRGRAVPAAVISARAAATVWPGEDPLGRMFTRGDPSSRFEVVGVVSDGHPTSLETQSPLMVYVPYWVMNEGKSVLMVRTANDTTRLTNELRQVIRSVDPEIAVVGITPLQTVVDKAVATRRYQMWLFTAFGGVALLIATVGVYATTAYGVSRRRREMNLRVALGARTSQVFALVVRQSAAPLVAGILIGSAGALAAGTAMASFLFQVRPNDPLIVTTVVALVGAVGLVACASAVRQGLRIDPAAALRND